MAHTGRSPGRAVTWAGLAPVAQLDRAGGFYPSGCAFESCRGRRSPRQQCGGCTVGAPDFLSPGHPAGPELGTDPVSGRAGRIQVPDHLT